MIDMLLACCWHVIDNLTSHQQADDAHGEGHHHDNGQLEEKMTSVTVKASEKENNELLEPVLLSGTSSLWGPAAGWSSQPRPQRSSPETGRWSPAGKSPPELSAPAQLCRTFLIQAVLYLTRLICRLNVSTAHRRFRVLQAQLRAA